METKSPSHVIYTNTHCDNGPSLSHAGSEMLKRSLLTWTEHFKAVIPLLWPLQGNFIKYGVLACDLCSSSILFFLFLFIYLFYFIFLIGPSIFVVANTGLL